jgi:hypothetical protein
MEIPFHNTNSKQTFWTNKSLHEENNIWAGGVSQVVEFLPSKCETLSLTSRTTKKIKKCVYLCVCVCVCVCVSVYERERERERERAREHIPIHTVHILMHFPNKVLLPLEL